MSLTISVLEAQWAALVEKRMTELQEAWDRVLPQQRLSVIELINNSPLYEDQFDALEEQIRELDPDHHLLAENQYQLN